MFYQTNCTQTTALPSPPAVTEWSRLLVLEVICSMHVTMHFHWGGNLSLVILTFDLDIQSHSSEGPNTSSLWIWCKSVQWFLRYLIHKQKSHSAKNRTLLAYGNDGKKLDKIFSPVHTLHKWQTDSRLTDHVRTAYTMLACHAWCSKKYTYSSLYTIFQQVTLYCGWNRGQRRSINCFHWSSYNSAFKIFRHLTQTLVACHSEMSSR